MDIPANNSSDIPSLTESRQQQVENLIHFIRGHQVMLDSDIARLYGVETKALNQAVKRNIERFPSDFMFQLTKEECLRSQIVTLNPGRGKHLKYMPYAFTENGVAMLSGILRSPIAIDANIRIMRAFTAMRRFVMNNAYVFQRLESLERGQLLLNQHQSETDERIDKILSTLDGSDKRPIEGILYDGQIFDAYTLIADIIRMARKRVILIDNFVDDRVLKALDKRSDGVSAQIYTDVRRSHIELDAAKHNTQYAPIEIIPCHNVHDRFLIIDQDLYFIGGSIKDLGKKIVAFSRMSMSPDTVLDHLK